jgi:PBSX family phage terminase large subunit
LDEAIEFTEEEFEEMTYGLRSKFGSMQVYMATNPGPPNKDQWLYRKFFIEKNKDHKVITTSSYDNFYLPETFFDSFKYMDQDRRKRMVDGQWVAIEGQVFKNFSKDAHVKDLTKNGYEEYYLGIDWGQTHLAAFILAGVTKGCIYVLEEVARKNLLIDAIKKMVVDIKEKYPNVQIIYDPSAPLISNELRNIGVSINKANNDVNVGIDRIRNRLGNGSLYIDTSCEKTVMEFENYVYKINSEVPVKKGDDCLDAIRYIVNAVDDCNGGQGIFLLSGGDMDDMPVREPFETRDEYWERVGAISYI